MVGGCLKGSEPTYVYVAISLAKVGPGFGVALLLGMIDYPLMSVPDLQNPLVYRTLGTSLLLISEIRQALGFSHCLDGLDLTPPPPLD